VSVNLDGPSVDALLIADFAQAIEGKLYVMGGGFNQLLLADFGLPGRFYFGAILHIPWEDSNRRIPIEGFLQTVDGERLEGFRLHGDIQTGRAAEATPGTASVVAIAGPVEFSVAGPGDLQFLLRFGGDQRSQRFSVRQAGPVAAGGSPT
jgi:uncharacterized protein DUF6941